MWYQSVVDGAIAVRTFMPITRYNLCFVLVIKLPTQANMPLLCQTDKISVRWIRWLQSNLDTKVHLTQCGIKGCRVRGVWHLRWTYCILFWRLQVRAQWNMWHSSFNVKCIQFKMWYNRMGCKTTFIHQVLTCYYYWYHFLAYNKEIKN